MIKMLTKNIELNQQVKLLTRDALDAYDPESESWQKQFARRYTHHSELMNVLNKVEN